MLCEQAGMIRYLRSFVQSDSSREAQIELLKTFIVLFIVRSLRLQSVKFGEIEVEISSPLLSLIFFIFGSYCLIHVLRILRDYYLFVEQTAKDHESLAKQSEEEISATVVQEKSLRQGLIDNISRERLLAAKIHPIFNLVVSLIDFVLPAFLTLTSYFLAFYNS